MSQLFWEYPCTFFEPTFISGLSEGVNRGESVRPQAEPGWGSARILDCYPKPVTPEQVVKHFSKLSHFY